MAGQTLTTFDAILKEVYRGPIVELLNQETYLIDQLEKTNVNNIGTWTGREVVFPVHTARNRARGGIGDGGTLATAGSQSYLDGKVAIHYFNAAIELTDLVIRQSQTDEGAFVRALTSEMEGATQDLKKDMSRMCYGTGDGLLATVSGTPGGGTSITVDNGQYIAVGDVVDIIVKTTGATTNGVVGTTVTAVSFTGTANSSTQKAATLTIGTTTAGATSNLYGVYITGDRSQETDGLRNITATGRTLHGINSSTYPIWDGNEKDAANSNISEDLCMQLAQQIRQKSGKGIDTFLGTYGIQRRLANTYTSQKRWNDAKAVSVDGGYSAINVSSGGDSVPVVADTDAANGFLFALNKGSFAWAELDKPDWLKSPDGQGSVLHLKDGSTAGTKVASWQAWMSWPATLVNVAPIRNGRIINLNDDIPFPRV